MSAEILTFGCRLNAYESELIRGLTAQLDDTLVINSCAVTAEAERQARQAIRRARRDRPGARIVVTGCAAQISPERWSALPGVVRVLGNAEKLDPAAWQDDARVRVADIMSPAPIAAMPVHGFAGRARALVQIQQGCDHHCTFCVIPQGRGRNRSVDADAVVARIKTLADAGYREAVLTGVDIASYGADAGGGLGLGGLLRRILAGVPNLARLRLSSLDPGAMDDDLWALIEGEERLMPHLHLSLQSASGLILKRMRRRHTPLQASDIVARARALRPGMAIGADLIAGFASETDALAEETQAWVERHALPYLHVFPYSERPGTPAARMPAVPSATRRARAARLRAAGTEAALAWHQRMVGQHVTVLTEAGGGGHTPAFAPVRLSGGFPPGQFVQARVTAADAGGLTAEPI